MHTVCVLACSPMALLLCLLLFLFSFSLPTPLPAFPSLSFSYYLDIPVFTSPSTVILLFDHLFFCLCIVWHFKYSPFCLCSTFSYSLLVPHLWDGEYVDSLIASSHPVFFLYICFYVYFFSFLPVTESFYGNTNLLL